jgi:hypothetical protein
MASFVLTNAYVLINSIDHSDHVRQVKINYSAETPENTAMGSVGSKTRLPGLKDWSLEIEFNQDYAAANVDEKMFALVGAAAFAIEVKPVNTTRGPTNPSYTGNALLAEYAPLGQKVGDVAVAPVKLVGTGALTRLTA